MQSKTTWRGFAALLVLGLVASACPADPTDGPTDGRTSGIEPVEVTIGTVLPESGFLDYLGAPMIAGVDLAVSDVNDDGNVSITLLKGDSATDGAKGLEAVNQHLSDGAQIIVGAGASGVTGGFLETTVGQNVANCSPSATSSSFVTNPLARLMARTVPPDDAVVQVIVDTVVADARTKVVIVGRQDDYGDNLVGLLETGLAAADIETVTVRYSDDATTYDAVTQEILDAAGDSAIFVSFKEATTIMRSLIEADQSPDTWYGADGVFSGQLAALTDPDNANILDGMKFIGASGDKEFNDRLATAGTADFLYGAQAYDCIVLIALALLATGGDTGGDVLIAAMIEASTDGEKCTTYVACVTIIKSGGNPDYDGPSGNIELVQSVIEPSDENPEGGFGSANPTVARYTVAQYVDGALVALSSTDVNLGGGEVAPSPTASPTSTE